MDIKKVKVVKSKPPQFKRPKNYHPIKVFFLLFAVFFLAFYFIYSNGNLSFNKKVQSLTYETLLVNTNNQRQLFDKKPLQLDEGLSKAATAKALDMVQRNYWSHYTPDGQPPWYFLNQINYKYSKAGENLSYGFSSSPEVIRAWMNSPSHRANLLDTGFNKVGFGIATSSNFNGKGPSVVVVAMYANDSVTTETPAEPQGFSFSNEISSIRSFNSSAIQNWIWVEYLAVVAVVFLIMYLFIKYGLVIHAYFSKKQPKLTPLLLIDLIILVLIVLLAIYVYKQMGYIM